MDGEPGHGLGSPAATVTFHRSDDDQTLVLHLGEVDADGAWVRRGDEEALTLYDAAVADALRPTPLRFRARQLVSLEPGDARSLGIEAGGLTERATRGEGGTWTLEAPSTMEADRVVVRDIARRLATLAAERFDGWMPIFVSPYRMDIFEESLANKPEGFEINAMVNCIINDNLEEAMFPGKMTMALYLGGMGARKDNFHKNLMGRMGFGDEAEKVQDLWYDGKHEEAIKAVPDALVDEISLVGPKERIKERLQDWKKSPVTSLMIGHRDHFETSVETMEFLAEAVL